jgi:TRAP transporter TAXI family solute receptor
MRFRILLPVIIASVLGSQASAEPLTFATGWAGGTTNRMAIAIAKAYDEHEGGALRVQPFGSTAQFMPLVDKGEAAFGAANALELQFAYSGSGTFEGRSHKNLRLISASFPFRLVFMTKESSSIRDAAQVRNARVPSEFPKAPIASVIIAGLLANAGLDYGDVDAVPTTGFKELHEAFVADRIDVNMMIVGAGYINDIARRSGGVRALSISDSDEAVAAMRKHVPVARVVKIEPAPNIIGVTESINAMAYDYFLFTGKDVDEKAVYAMTKLLHDRTAELAESVSSFNDFRREAMATDIGVPFHPGAVKFYREQGLWKD